MEGPERERFDHQNELPLFHSTECHEEGLGFAGELARYYEWERAANNVDEECYVIPGKPKNSRRFVDFMVPVSKFMPGNTLRSLCKRAGLIDEDDAPITRVAESVGT